ncbi:hypothetical protein [Pyruvatibacter mobilis]|uniref:hypothetical protein n=1 Tax=Pyruvatibacter mobilis TaxID=1712261 RepID=UPI003BB0366B
MSAAVLTATSPEPFAAPLPERTHRFGRALDDRMAAQGDFARHVAEQARTAAADGSGPDTPITTASLSDEEGEGLSFDDFLDVINPLQHLPVVSSIYRHLTDDEISAPAKVAGGALFGGVLGLAGSLLDVAVEEFSGDDMGGHVMTALFGDDDPAKGTDTLLAESGDAPPQDEPAAQANAASARVADEVAAVQAAAARQAALQSKAQASGAGPARPPHASALGGAPVPNLSPAAFDALMESFGTSAESTGQDHAARDTSLRPDA